MFYPEIFIFSLNLYRRVVMARKEAMREKRLQMQLQQMTQVVNSYYWET